MLRVEGVCRAGCSVRGDVESAREVFDDQTCPRCFGVVTITRVRKACCGAEVFSDCTPQCPKVRRSA